MLGINKTHNTGSTIKSVCHFITQSINSRPGPPHTFLAITHTSQSSPAALRMSKGDSRPCGPDSRVPAAGPATLTIYSVATKNSNSRKRHSGARKQIQGLLLLTQLNCFTSHFGEHRTICALWKGQGIPCFCKIPTVQWSSEKEMAFVYVSLATHVTLAMAWYSPCLFGCATTSQFHKCGRP